MNTLFLGKKTNISLFCSLLALSIFFTGCQTKPKKTTPQTRTDQTQAPTVDVDVSPDDEVPPTQPPAPKPKPVPKKVGLILGPGAMRTFAHVGVLKNFHEAKIPISQIVGLEWGALPAYYFAGKGQVHEVEWKMLRLKETDLPQKGFFSSRVSPSRASQLNDYLNITAKGENVQDVSIGFACPSFSPQQSKMQWMRRGDAIGVLKACVAYPPLYQGDSDWIADPFAVEEAAQQLRERGANFIIFVNVLGTTSPFGSSQAKNYYSEFLLWRQMQRSLGKARFIGVDAVISAPVSRGDIMNFEGRRDIMTEGQQTSRKAIFDLSNRFEF